MTSHEDLMFQFDSGSAAEEDPLQRMPDLESQQGDNYTTPRGFDDDELLSINTNGDDETLFSRSTATTLLGQTPDVSAAAVRNNSTQWSRDYTSASNTGSSTVASSRRPTIDRSIVTGHITTTLDDNERRAASISSASDHHHKASSHRFSLPNLFHSIRRINPSTNHPSVSVVSEGQDPRRHSLNQAMVFSNYNNYLNDCIFDDSVKTVDQERKLRLEQLADKFWLRDGSIDEDMFDESSDEEHEEQEEISHHNHRRSSLTRKSKSVL
ncbi:Spl2 [Kluyveromyces lactis]|nr:Spl2 [Kluyveromyces lactis]